MYSVTQNISLENQETKKLSIPDSETLENIFSTMLETIVSFFEYVMGALIGAMIGWAAGWSIGHIYQGLYEPIHFINFETVEFWYFLPQTFAQYGAAVGACFSIPVVYFVLNKNVNQSSGEKE